MGERRRGQRQGAGCGIALAAVFGGLLAASAAGAVPGDPISLELFAPETGAFVTGPDLLFEGRVTTSDVLATEVLLDGGLPLPLLLLGVDGDGALLADFSVLLPLDPTDPFPSAHLQVTGPGGDTLRAHRVWVQGPVLPRGELSPESSALHVTPEGLAKLGPFLESQVDFDLESVLPVGTRIYRKCVVDTPFGCAGKVKVKVAKPAPSLERSTLDLSLADGAAALLLRLEEIRIDLDVDGDGVIPSCDLRLKADLATGSADLVRQPDATGGPDVGQAGDVVVDLSGFDQNFDGGACDQSDVRNAIDKAVGRLKGTVKDALRDLLEDPDGSGPEDAPLAEVAEEALDGVDLVGPIGEALGATLRTPLAAVDLLAAGATLRADTLLRAEAGDCDLPEDAIDPAATLDPDDDPLPVFGPVTPAGGLAYDAGLALSDGALNQGLAAFTRCGLLDTEVDRLDLGGGEAPLRAGDLAAFLPAFGALDPATPLRLRLRPGLAPVMGMGPGPGGEAARLLLAGLSVDVLDDADARWLGLRIAGEIGLDLAVDAGRLALRTGSVLSDLEVAVLDNAIGVDEATLGLALDLALGLGFPGLSSELGDVELPAVLGLDLAPVEVAREPGSLALYLEARPAPEPGAGAGLAGLAACLAGLRRIRRASR